MVEGGPSSGWLEGPVHVLPLRVYWEDSDGTGVVYYANYLKFVERARTDLLRLAGIEQKSLLDDGSVMFAVRRCEVDYLAPAHLDDELEIHTRFTDVRGASLQAEQIVRRDGTDLVRANVRVACLDRSGKPKRLPDSIKDSLVALPQSKSTHIPTRQRDKLVMENQAIDAAILAGSVGAADLSLIGLFWRADAVVKAVLLVLILASFWCWAIIAEKILRLRRLVVQADGFEESFWSGGSLEDLYDRIGGRPDHPMAFLFAAAMREWRRSTAGGGGGEQPLHAGIQERIGQVMQLTMNREVENLERYLGFLATVGSTAPFIGLFGTVWGIMNSFQAIALTKNTSLAVVAPGIAEALFATALGLVAAIPAVVAYNKFSTDIVRYANRLESFAGEFSAILSRQLEERSQAS